MEARGRPAFLSGESPASVITSSPILSNSGRAPLVLPASTSFRARRPSSLPTAPLCRAPPSLSPLSFELVVPRLESFFPLPFRAQQFPRLIVLIVSSLSCISLEFFKLFSSTRGRKKKKERNLESLNVRIDTCPQFVHST